MAFKSIVSVLEPDPRFDDLVLVENGTVRRMTLADHHRSVAGIGLSGTAPAESGGGF